MRQLLTESLLLSATGGVAGINLRFGNQRAAHLRSRILSG